MFEAIKILPTQKANIESDSTPCIVSYSQAAFFHQSEISMID